MFTIQEVSHKLKISKHTLRFWEKELEGLIVPLRTQGGQRRYTSEHLFVIKEIRRLKDKGLSLAQIRNKLGNDALKVVKENRTQVTRIENLADEVAEVVRSAVYNYLQGISGE